MFNATEFTYDGVYSGIYGLKIATINGEILEETSYITPTIETAKPAKAKKFFYEGMTYEEPPTFDFSIVSQDPIPDILQREIMLWLDSRKGFKPLLIHQPEHEGYTYNCIFTITSTLYHAGNCVGFLLTATFDSLYQYRKSKVLKVTGDGTAKEYTLMNDSDIVDDYVYPTVEFKTRGYVKSNCNISIVNKTDDVAMVREFKFNDIALNATVTVDNELKIISSSMGSDLLSKFDGKKWLRLRRGKNLLQIQINGEVTITCPTLTKIRF